MKDEDRLFDIWAKTTPDDVVVLSNPPTPEITPEARAEVLRLLGEKPLD